MKKLFYFTSIVLLSKSVYALDLQEALTIAYCKNDDLKIIRNNFLVEIEQFSDAFSNFLPQINYGINVQDGNTKVPRRFSATIPESQRSTTKTFSIKQPIFNGGGSVAGLKAAQSIIRYAKAKYYSEEQKVILDLIKAFLDCYAAKERYEISLTNVEANQRQLDSVEEQLKLGEATQINLQTAKSGLYDAETKKLTEFANYQGTKANFLKLFGVEACDLVLPQLENNLPNCQEKLLQIALNKNFNIEGAKHVVQARKAAELSAKSNLLPSIDFNIQNSKVHYKPQIPTTSMIDNNSIATVVSINIPIYQRGTEYTKIRRARKSTREAAIQLDNTTRQVRASTFSSWEALKASRSKITSTTQAVEAAQISYDGTMQEEMVGSKTILDVLFAQQKLYNAKIDKVNAYNEALNTYYQVKSLMGELTAKSFKLRVRYFDPDEEFRSIKKQLIIGF